MSDYGIHPNELPLREDTYILCLDEDRYNDAEYSTEDEAVEAMYAIGKEGMWVGYNELINGNVTVIGTGWEIEHKHDEDDE